jgi:hypothetical protein
MMAKKRSTLICLKVVKVGNNKVAVKPRKCSLRKLGNSNRAVKAEKGRNLLIWLKGSKGIKWRYPYRMTTRWMGS